MWCWFFIFLLILYSFDQLLSGGLEFRRNLRFEPNGVVFKGMELTLFDIEERLKVGVVPEEEQWKLVGEFPSPWGSLMSTLISQVRDSGLRVLPILTRFRMLVRQWLEQRQKAAAQTASSWVQTGICLFISPFLGVFLLVWIPLLSEFIFEWVMVVLICTFLCGIAGFQILKLSQNARYGGISSSRRSWLLCSFVFPEYLIAQIQGGVTPDFAWEIMIRQLKNIDPDLAHFWGPQIWNEDIQTVQFDSHLEERISQFGCSMKRTIQYSLIEGVGVFERLESTLNSFKQETELGIEKELNLLSTRVFKPLYLLVAPAILFEFFAGIGMMFIKEMKFLE
tara:strand:- start:3601 stop:4611 length:1011 start_codon:yes stop_codon:yes gene_type:complete